MDDDNYTTHSSDSHCHHGIETAAAAVLFLFLSFFIGAAVRHLFENKPLPCTVILMVVGLGVGAAPRWSYLSFLNRYLCIAQLDPHLMLTIFLPTLIFESAFVLDVHAFKKMIWQACLLAGPGLFFSSGLTAIMARFILSYNWSWAVAFLFGIIISATDPVTIVALLRELGISKQLGTIIEGESLLNDGVAIVLFNVLLNGLMPGTTTNALYVFLYFLRVALGGPLFGYLAARIATFWLSRVYNNALVEIAITLASTYITYYIGEELLGVSGVLAVVTLGFEINARKTSISPEVQVHLHRVWEFLGYFANTLIFVLVGVVISQRAFQNVDPVDWMFLGGLYLGIIVIRMVVTAGLFPILTRIGYAIDMRQVLVISWGGLKGAVGLALALVVAQTSSIEFNMIGSKVLFHTAGIVILTLVINATTTKYLLRALGMRDVSIARCRAMSSAVKMVNEANQRIITRLKSDKFLADANWDVVYRLSTIPNPYEHIELAEKSAGCSSLNNHCPECSKEMPRLLNEKDLAELAEEIRRKIIKGEKTSYLHQFEQGMLSQEVVRVLINLADTVLDTPERLITHKDIALHWQIPKVYSIMRQFLNFIIGQPISVKYPPPRSRFLMPFYKIAINQFSEWFIYLVIVINFILTISQMLIMDRVIAYHLTILNAVFCLFFYIDIVVKIVGLRKHYWFVKWNYFDISLLIYNTIDIVLSIVFVTHNMATALIVFRPLRVARLTRFFRSTNPILPLLMKFVDYFVNRRLRFGYDIGRGFVVGEDDVLPQFDGFKLIDEEIARKLKYKVEETRLNTIRSLGLIRKEHPNIAFSVKTQHATRAVFNNSRETVRSKISNRQLDEADARKLMNIVERKIKRLENTSASLPPPDPDTMFSQLLWLDGLQTEIVDHLKMSATLCQFDTGDLLQSNEESLNGLFIITSGLVKVFNKVHSSGLESTCNTGIIITDFLGPGAVLGEPKVFQNLSCKTDVQGFFIPQAALCEAMEQFPVLEERLWKIYGVRHAFLLLQRQPEYQEWSANMLSKMCENSYAVCSHPSNDTFMFEITEAMREVIVIDGSVHCVVSGAQYTAPCVIPKRVQHIYSSHKNAKLLIIPNKEIPIVPQHINNPAEDYGRSKLVRIPKMFVRQQIKRIRHLITHNWVWDRINGLLFQQNRIIPDVEAPPELCDSCLAQRVINHQRSFHVVPPTKSNSIRPNFRAVASSTHLSAQGGEYTKRRLHRTSSTGDVPIDIHKILKQQQMKETNVSFTALPTKAKNKTLSVQELSKEQTKSVIKESAKRIQSAMPHHVQGRAMPSTAQLPVQTSPLATQKHPSTDHMITVPSSSVLSIPLSTEMTLSAEHIMTAPSSNERITGGEPLATVASLTGSIKLPPLTVSQENEASKAQGKKKKQNVKPELATDSKPAPTNKKASVAGGEGKKNQKTTKCEKEIGKEKTTADKEASPNFRAVASSTHLSAEGDAYTKRRLRRTSSTGDAAIDIHKIPKQQQMKETNVNFTALPTKAKNKTLSVQELSKKQTKSVIKENTKRIQSAMPHHVQGRAMPSTAQLPVQPSPLATQKHPSTDHMITVPSSSVLSIPLSTETTLSAEHIMTVPSSNERITGGGPLATVASLTGSIKLPPLTVSQENEASKAKGKKKKQNVKPELATDSKPAPTNKKASVAGGKGKKSQKTTKGEKGKGTRKTAANEEAPERLAAVDADAALKEALAQVENHRL